MGFGMSYDLLKTSKALADGTRLALYHYLEKPHQEPVSVQHLAEHFKLHPNAIRQHLAKLEDAGLVYSEASRPSGSGRPHQIYRRKGPLHGLELLPRDYKLLCEMLLEYLSFSKVSMDDIKAFGKRWGEKRVKEWIKEGDHTKSAEEATQLLLKQFSAWGFEPRLIVSSDQRIDIRLQNCIFREVVEFHPELVCPLLHGILEGLLNPFVGEHHSGLENGIAHGEDSCHVLVTLKA
jgi:predicted ArsR family transcriptional regulator